MQPSERPRFREDLVAEPVDDGGIRFIDVMDPDSGNVFRFYEAEYSLACGMDGERDVGGIVRWANDELGMQPSPKEVRTVIDTLGQLGYLDGGKRAVAAAAPIAGPGKAAGMPELEPGVVVPPKAPIVPSADLELGRAGTPVSAKEPDIGRAPTFELGAPGSLAARGAPHVPAQDIALGNPGARRDFSTDLAADVPIRPDDVKEAVRASQVMRAVDVPKELLDSLEEPTITEPRTAAAHAEAARVANVAPVARPVTPPPVAEPRRVEAPVQIKPTTPTVPREPRPDSRPRPPSDALPNEPQRSSPLRLILILVVVLAALGVVAWKFVFTSQDETPAPPEKPAPAAVTPVKPPEPPPVEAEKLAREQPDAIEIKIAGAGQVETIAAAGDVKPEDVLVALVGHKPIETEVAGLSRDLDKRYRPELEQAQKDRATAEASGNKAQLAAADKKVEDKQKALDDKQAKLDAKKGDLAKYVTHAPSAGTVTPVAKANTKVAANDVVAKLVPPAILVATFKSTSQPVQVGARVFLAVKGADKRLACSVTATGDAGAKIACPQDAAAEGTEVTFAGLDTSTPPGEIDMTEGSGSGSAASPAGSAPAPATRPAPPPRPHPAPPPPPPPPSDKQPAPSGSSAPAADPGSAAPAQP